MALAAVCWPAWPVWASALAFYGFVALLVTLGVAWEMVHVWCVRRWS